MIEKGSHLPLQADERYCFSLFPISLKEDLQNASIKKGREDVQLPLGEDVDPRRDRPTAENGPSLQRK